MQVGRKFHSDGDCVTSGRPRRVSDVTSSSSLDIGLFHRAMSRRKTLAEFDSPLSLEFPTEDDEVFGGDVTESQGDASKQRNLSPLERFHAIVVQARARERQLSLERIGEDYEAIMEEEIVSISRDGVSKPGLRRSKYSTSQGEVGLTLKGETITIYPGSQKQSNISLANWKVEKDSPPPKVVEKARTPTPEPPKPPTPPAPKPKTPSPPVSEPPFEYEYIAGHEASVGGNSPMTLSHKSDDIEGIETIVGPSRPMSPESPNAVMENPTPSSSQPNDPSKRRKKTVRSVFRMGLFLSRKNKRKPALSPDAGPTDEPTFNPAPRRHPMVQRRQSRLEMNEPIEDIFSDVKFETIEKIEESSSPNAEYDSDVIEDPDVVVMTSLLEKQASFPSDEAAGRDFVKFDDVTTDNVTTPSSNQDHEHWDDLT
uniref:serine/arginine repetitive matrix protein 1-like isoform X2 n=1 Tax=Ciona intestinalis TaxID=7719 RepID=UPI00089DBD1B|nr:serine/arginine repetitive matrix protein 1-like isoform X2 [Ciona intestinalis]|eukprot:XP_002128125.2 serine/arginine repetitive matrix protein 1-like isoform X2 [Ciona intestinalis]